MDEQVRILLVDDEENVLKAVKRIFLDTDYEIITAASAAEGLEILKRAETIQVVISDYRMPKMNGVDFLREVYDYWPDTIRIILSGYADTVAIIEAINVGHIYKFIPKPWNDMELKVAISNALDRYFIKQKNTQLTKELEAKNRELQKINNNLERLVTERTADLMIQNKILICSQNILDSLPVAVIGIDPEGQIVQCNKLGDDLFSRGTGNVMGTYVHDSLPEDINAFIERVTENESCSGSMQSAGMGVLVKGVHMKYSGGQEGIILVIDEGAKDAR